MDFGQFISEKRIQRSITISELAEKLGITKAYLSQLENGIRVNPSAVLLAQLVDILNMNQSEVNTMYALYSKASGQISPDVTEYVLSNEFVYKALQIALDTHRGECTQTGTTYIGTLNFGFKVDGSACHCNVR